MVSLGVQGSKAGLEHSFTGAHHDKMPSYGMLGLQLSQHNNGIDFNGL